jgi:hypothetical protein
LVEESWITGEKINSEKNTMEMSNIFNHTHSLVERAARLLHLKSRDEIIQHLHDLQIELNAQQHAESRILLPHLQRMSAGHAILPTIGEARQQEEEMINLCEKMQTIEPHTNEWQENLNLLHHEIRDHLATEKKLMVQLRSLLPTKHRQELQECVESEKTTLVIRHQIMEAGG